MKKINLEWGNPEFLFPWWDNYTSELDVVRPTPYMSKNQSEFLEDLIISLHKLVGNVKNPHKYNIVFGNGASQLISAILYETPGELVHAPAPYFSRFPVLSHIGDNFFINLEEKADKLILTAPSNPMNTFLDYETYCFSKKPKLIDACYNWPQYGNIKKLDDDIIVFSLSKMSGHAGLRFGWALIKNDELAEEVKNSIEMTTMGVGSWAEQSAIPIVDIILSLELYKKENIFSYGKKVLDSRWETIKELNLPFKILNNSGMFLYAKGQIPNHVSGLSGLMFGGKPDEFRLNIGCSQESFDGFIKPYTN